MNKPDLAKMSPIEVIKYLERRASDCVTLANHAKWTAQTVHQAYHQEHEGTWIDCPKDTCASTFNVLSEVLKDAS